VAVASDGYAEEDRKFETSLTKAMGQHLLAHFYTKVVGITFKNGDGVVREKLIAGCEQFDFVRLVPEPESPFGKNAIAVHLRDGSQVGYLGSRTAQEISTALRKGRKWLACVKFAQPKTGDKHGCLVLCMMEVDDEFAGRVPRSHAV
jgi:hypothetical protein